MDGILSAVGAEPHESAELVDAALGLRGRRSASFQHNRAGICTGRKCKALRGRCSGFRVRTLSFTRLTSSWKWRKETQIGVFVGGNSVYKERSVVFNRSGWCSGYHARFTRERSRVQSSHPIFFFQQTEDRFIFSRRLFISVIYTWTKGNDTTHCEYVATSEIISLCNSIVSLSTYARRAFKSHSVLYWKSPRPLPSLSLRTRRNNTLHTLLQFQKRLDRCHCILDRRFLLIDVCHHRIRRGSSQFRHLPSAQVDHFPKCVI